MKNLYVVIVLAFGINIYSQETVKSNDNKTELTCKLIKFDTEKNIFEYIGNVAFKNEIIQFQKAEKIVYNKETNEIVVSGLNDFTINGAIQVADNSKMKILRYKIGERIAYIE
jgi:hypothetical protein